MWRRKVSILLFVLSLFWCFRYSKVLIEKLSSCVEISDDDQHTVVRSCRVPGSGGP